MKVSNPWNVVDNKFSRFQSGMIIGIFLLSQFALFSYTGILAHHKIMGMVASFGGIIGAMFICMGVIVKVFTETSQKEST